MAVTKGNVYCSPRTRRLYSSCSACMCSRGGIHSRNGPHWAALLLETGFLRFVARVQAFPHCLRDLRAEAFTMMLSDEFPQYFGHRFVVTSAVKAARELVRNGDDTNMEVDDMRHAWSTFTNVLLEQTVINTVYERDFAENDLKKCENVRLPAYLFFCIGRLTHRGAKSAKLTSRR